MIRTARHLGKMSDHAIFAGCSVKLPDVAANGSSCSKVWIPNPDLPATVRNQVGGGLPQFLAQMLAVDIKTYRGLPEPPPSATRKFENCPPDSTAIQNACCSQQIRTCLPRPWNSYIPKGPRLQHFGVRVPLVPGLTVIMSSSSTFRNPSSRTARRAISP